MMPKIKGKSMRSTIFAHFFLSSTISLVLGTIFGSLSIFHIKKLRSLTKNLIPDKLTHKITLRNDPNSSYDGCDEMESFIAPWQMRRGSCSGPGKRKEVLKVLQLQNETVIHTPDKSTPVRAWTAGGNCPSNLLTSVVVLSAPPRRTISSVLANGAATSAAI